ncbi:MAG: hypothetical protein IT385_21825 [Deltaproteobacteria bacterium]|nr:hypothetical protein [Deltaproteobacteria bacterium]
MRKALALLALVGACADDPGFEDVARRALAPGPNPFDARHPQWSPQPHRDKPRNVLVDRAGRVWVALPGTVDLPSDAVARLDPEGGAIVRARVGSSPQGMALSPDGALLVVASRFADHLTVIGTEDARVLHHPGVDFYTVDVAFTPDGAELWLANRWRDAVSALSVVPEASGLRVLARDAPWIPVGANPHQLRISPDGATVAVASMTGLSVSLVDRATRSERARIDLGAPANGIAFVADLLIVATLSASTHHLPTAGPDTNGDGVPGDGTPNVNFQDLQNELVVIRASTGEVVRRYTSDTMCCRDFRDVDPADLPRLGALLPSRDTWIVGGALPEQVEADGAGGVWVTYSGSNELQRFALDPMSGALVPGPVWPAGGHNPFGVAARGGRLFVSHQLGETLGVLDAQTGAVLELVPVGDLSGGPFPATDVELGELVNNVTAPLTVDGDQACASCHRDAGNLDKALSMPLTEYPGVGLRMTMAYRGAFDTRPWFFESAMDESNFKPVLNEFARIENFCCSDVTLFPDGVPTDCVQRPPALCTSAPNPGSRDGFEAERAPDLVMHPRPTAALTRDAFYLERIEALTGRARSFGDGVFFQDPVTLERQPIRLDFDGLTRALGLFLMAEPRLLPNPNDPTTLAARRGRALFERPDVGCASCHPAPTFAVSTTNNPFDLPPRMGPVVTPVRDADGRNLDLLTESFLGIFPRAEMDLCVDVCGAACAEDASICDAERNVYFGVPSLRGIWDRAPRLLHDGRARGLREVLATPGHPALRPGETGFNERDGTIDTHGGTSHLSADDLEYLITYLETL